ncbi:MAG: hypothetical protein RI897_2349 [Verrucomicrobiota bacterium]
MGIDVKAPAGDIGLVGALVAGVTVAVVALPMPVVVEAFAGEFGVGVGGGA